MDFLPSLEKHRPISLTIPFSRENLKDIIDLYRIDLVVPGAEKFLYAGVSDWCQEWMVPCFGPTMAAAALERSKLYSKKLMDEAGIPTARYEDLTHAFLHEPTKLKKILLGFQRPVIKVSGPSTGKGVFVCFDSTEALKTLEEIKHSNIVGLEEGILVEEGLNGREISLFYACHDENFSFLGAAQDHKRLLDNDLGPNTGGMGAFSPVSWADEAFIQQSTVQFLIPTLKQMKKRGTPFKGVLFLGLMVDEGVAKLLEYNVRFGDPETQVLLPLIEGDLTQLLYAFAQGETAPGSIKLKDSVAVHVVKAAKGYPGTFGTEIQTNQRIQINQNKEMNSQIFFAAVRKEGSDLFSGGGRVFGVTAMAENKLKARELAYRNLSYLNFQGEQYRKDIGEKP